MESMTPKYPQYIKAVEYQSMTACLMHFRQLFEKYTNTPIQEANVNAAVFLADMAVFIGLSNERVRDVMGESAYKFVEMVENARVRDTTIH
jgi:hypothetical protein